MPRRSQPRERRSRPKKHLGQNFLIDTYILDQIADYVQIQPEDTVIEIGAGTGLLTARLAARARQVLAVEIDAQLHPQLEAECAEHSNIQFVQADVLKLDIAELIGGRPSENVRVVGNLPYYITTPILMRLLELRSRIATCVLMMQLEVAQRLVSPPGSRIYGAPSVAVAYHAEAKILRRVPPTVFRPRPKVESAILRLVMRAEPAVEVDDEAFFFRVFRGAFQHRRKTVRNALLKSGLCDGDAVQIDAALNDAEIPPTIRPEKLGIQEYARLANAVSAIQMSHQ